MKGLNMWFKREPSALKPACITSTLEMAALTQPDPTDPAALERRRLYERLAQRQALIEAEIEADCRRD